MENKDITLEEYTKLLASHDWFFEMSDDYSMWERGHAERTRLVSLTVGRPELEEAFRRFWEKMFVAKEKV